MMPTQHDITKLADQHFAESQRVADSFIDRLFAGLMMLQWFAAIAAAFYFSPRTWAGAESWIHPHVWWAVGLGALLAVMPVSLALTHPGESLTRMVIGAAQVSFSALLIHLTGGRIETHFHVFGSLAFLAFYRDWRVLAVATVIVSLDHFVRGVWYPASVFGTSSVSSYRWMEHAGWVLFEDVFLFLSIRRGIRESRLASMRYAQIELSHQLVEEQVRLRTAELVAANEKAKAAVLAKSQFLSNMSHEIRTPMTSIMGYADLLLDPKQSPSDRIDAVQTIRRNGDHLLSVINDILDVSKIEAGRMSVEHIQTDPAQILAEVCSLMRIRADEKDLSLRYEIEAPFPAVIHSDPVRLRQVLLNLVSNSIKFTSKGGVVIRASFDGDPEGRIRFDISDTGIGMAQDQIDRLFQPFTQADSTMTRRFGGTGLGLSISKKLSEVLGGGIAVQSTPGEGTTFTVTIATGRLEGVSMVPQQSIYQNTPGPGVPEQTLAGVSVLLAEDGIDNQRLIRHHLVRAGARVTVAENGRVAVDTAMDALSGQPFSLILMDMQMPELDGYGATSLLRAKGYSGPVIALTAHAMAGDREKCIKAGCDDYLTKPVAAAALIAMCVRWCRGSANERAA